MADGETTPPGSPSPPATGTSPPVDRDLGARQEGDLEELDGLVQSYTDGVNTPQTKAGREKIAEGCVVLRKLWLELEQQAGLFHGNHFPSLQLCRAAAKLFAKPDDGLGDELLQLGGHSVLGPLFRICGAPEEEGAVERNAEVRHYASNLIYRLAPSKIGIEWVTNDLSKVDAVSALFGHPDEPGPVREHAAAVLLSFSRIVDLQDQLTQPETIDSLIRTLTHDKNEDDFAHTLRRYAGTILADLSAVPSLHRHIAEDPGKIIPAVIELLRGSDAVDAPVGKRTAASILSNLSQDAELQMPIVQFGGLEPLYEACGENILEPKDTKLQLLSLFTLANISSSEDVHSQILGEAPGSPPQTAGSRPGTAVSFDGDVMQSPPATASTPPLMRVILPLMTEDVRPQTQRQRYAMAILTRLGRSPHNQDRIGSHASILRRILIVMSRVEAEAAAARQAVSLLSVLSVNPRNQMRIARMRLPVALSSEDTDDDEHKRAACYMLMTMLRSGVEANLSRCAACTLTNVAANVDAHSELFACTDMVQHLFELIQRHDTTLQRYACDALSNLALGSHRRPPTRDNDAAQEAEMATVSETGEDGGKAKEYKVEFPSRAQCTAMCKLIPLDDEVDDDETPDAENTDVDSLALQEHVVNALCSLGRCRANQVMMKEESGLLKRLGKFVNFMLDKMAAAAAETAAQDRDLPAVQVDEQPLIFALRLLGALCPSETPDDQEVEPEIAQSLMRAAEVAPMRTALVSLNALRKMCKNPAVHQLCAESDHLLAAISRHLDSGIRHLMKEKMNRPIRRSAAELLFKLTGLPQSVAKIETTCSQDYLVLDRPLGDVIGACLKVCDLTPDEAPELKAAACGAMFNASSQSGTAVRIADEPILMSFAIPLLGVDLDKLADDFIPRQRLQEYAVALLSNVATVPATVPRLLQHVATVSPNGVRGLTRALHDQLINAAACLTTTAEERWEFTQTTEKIRSGCYAAALISKLTTHAEFRAATIVKKPVEGEDNEEAAPQVAADEQEGEQKPVRRKRLMTSIEAVKLEKNAGEQAEHKENETEADPFEGSADVIDDDDRKGTNRQHRALDREWWTDTLSYECPIADKMFRLLDNDEAMADESNLGHHAAITLWHLTSSPEDDQRVRRTIGSNTNGWVCLATCISRRPTTMFRKRPDSRQYVIATMWNLLRVVEFQPKARYTDNLMSGILTLCNGIAREDPEYHYGDHESISSLRTRLAGLLTELVRDPENAKTLAQAPELHKTLIGWLDVEDFEEEIAAAKLQQAEEGNTSQGNTSAAKWGHAKSIFGTEKKLQLHEVIMAKRHEALEFEKKHSFAERTIFVRHIGKTWLDENMLCERFGAEYGGVVGAVVRVKTPETPAMINEKTGQVEDVWIPPGQQGYHAHQSWAMITFDHAGVVNRIFQHPLNPKVVLETVELKADPEEVDHIDDPDVVFAIVPVDPAQAMASTGAFGEKFEELRGRVQHMTKLTKRSHHVLQMLIHTKYAGGKLTEHVVRAERESIIEKRSAELELYST